MAKEFDSKLGGLDPEWPELEEELKKLQLQLQEQHVMPEIPKKAPVMLPAEEAHHAVPAHSMNQQSIAATPAMALAEEPVMQPLTSVTTDNNSTTFVALIALFVGIGVGTAMTSLRGGRKMPRGQPLLTTSESRL
jgi:hypothetical protein